MTDILSILTNGDILPASAAFLLGILASISPCPLAANIAAIAYLSRGLRTVRNILSNGFYYAFGRAASYTLLAILIYYGLSSFQISNYVQSWGGKLLGPLLVFIGLAMLGIIKIKLPQSGIRLERLKFWLAGKGEFGSFLLGAVLALAFCPYSAVLFFGVLVPLIMESPGGLLLPPLFALGTGLPVVIASFLIAFCAQKLGKALRAARTAEKIMRFFAALAFIFVGIYYILIKFN